MADNGMAIHTVRASIRPPVLVMRELGQNSAGSWSHECQSTARARRHRRKGLLSMELVFVLPVVLIVLFGLIELSLLFSARQTLVAASRSGARTAALAGATFDDVKQTIQAQVTGTLCDQLTIDVDLGQRSGDPVFVVLSVPMRIASPDLLRFVGFGLDDRELVAETVMSKE